MSISNLFEVLKVKVLYNLGIFMSVLEMMVVLVFIYGVYNLCYELYF